MWQIQISDQKGEKKQKRTGKSPEIVERPVQPQYILTESREKTAEKADAEEKNDQLVRPGGLRDETSNQNAKQNSIQCIQHAVHWMGEKEKKLYKPVYNDPAVGHIPMLCH